MNQRKNEWMSAHTTKNDRKWITLKFWYKLRGKCNQSVHFQRRSEYRVGRKKSTQKGSNIWHSTNWIAYYKCISNSCWFNDALKYYRAASTTNGSVEKWRRSRRKKNKTKINHHNRLLSKEEKIQTMGF